MIEKALRYVVGLKEPNYREINGRMYVDKDVTELTEPTVKPLRVNTLKAVVDYVVQNCDEILSRNSKIIVQIANYDKVAVFGQLNNDLNRDYYLEAVSLAPNNFRYGSYFEMENFNTALQSMFEETEDRNLLLALCGNVTEETIKNYSDNGISQTATIKSGVTTVQEVLVPNPVKLKPIRTFYEVEQPESLFVFRMKSGPFAALFEADGGAWKQQAINNIALYLDEALNNNITYDLRDQIIIL